MPTPTYSELLRDPRWQKMRLKKLESSKWRCERCVDTETTLHVHHKRYVKGRMPWEYDEAELVVLCEPCHEIEHDEKDFRTALLARLAVDGPLCTEDFFAYGAGALSAFAWLVDETLAAMFAQVRNGKPLQYEAGRAGAALAELGIGQRWLMRSQDLQHIADLIAADEDFARDLVDLLRKHGVPVADAKGG